MSELQDTAKKHSFKEEIINPKISVIVPVYNTGKYIKKCLLSLNQQTLNEIEIICVDDSSEDDSCSIISTLAKYDSRIKLIKQEHKLQGAARNNGMRAANGEYIGFVDSDDWVDLDYFEKLYNAAKKYDSDIALATNVRTGNGKTKKRLNITEEKFVTSLQGKFEIGNHAKNPCPTNKIYRREMLENNKIAWPEGIYCEDKLFVTQAIYYSNGVVSVPEINYYYFRNPNSTVNTKSKKHCKKTFEDKNNARKSVVEFLRKHQVDFADKKYWFIKKDYRFIKIMESIKTKKYLLFGIIPIREVGI